MSWDRLTADPEMLSRMRPPDPVLAEALERSAALGLRGASAEVCRLLEILAGERTIERIVEVGRGVGAATICLARGGSSSILSLDSLDDHLAEATELVRKAAVEDRVSFSTGDLLASVATLEGRFDMVHLSVDPGQALRLADRLLPALRVGGLLTVAGIRPTSGPDDERARAVAGYLLMHPQLDSQVLAIGDGLLVARKKAPFVTELGGPF